MEHTNIIVENAKNSRGANFPKESLGKVIFRRSLGAIGRDFHALLAPLLPGRLREMRGGLRFDVRFTAMNFFP